MLQSLIAAQGALQYFTWYDYDANQPGNLAFSLNLTELDAVHATNGRKGLWDIGDGMCGQTHWCGTPPSQNDSTPCGKVWGEPFCGGPKGPTKNYLAELDKIAALLATRPHIAGVFLGDEGILLGVDENAFCTLANRTKAALAAAGRADVFVYFNDGPTEMRTAIRWQRSHGNCGDYFSMDSYTDTGEPAYNAQIYTSAKGDLLPGQGFFFVPGLFWYMDRSPEQMREFEPNLMAKLSGDYQFATSPELRDVIVGFNPWHYKNRPTCAQDWCCRGAEGFGNLTALATAIARNIRENRSQVGLAWAFTTAPAATTAATCAATVTTAPRQTLAEMVTLLRRELGLGGEMTMKAVVDRAARELGVEGEGRSLIEVASWCCEQLVRSSE